MPRYASFTLFGKHRWGRVTDDGVRAVRGSVLDAAFEEEGEVLPWHAVTLDPPVRPTKVVCVGRNFRAHAKELDHEVPAEPLLFLKPPSSLLAHGAAIVHPRDQTELVHHEGELAAVIGRRTRRVAPERALERVVGFTILNDVTARDLQRRDGQWTRAKGFDTFCPLGPWLDTDFRPAAQLLTVTVNGHERQRGTLDQMVFSVEEVIAYASRFMTLEQGDVLALGTPAGVGPLVPGDTVEVTIEGLGTLSNPVVAEEQDV